MKKRKTWIYVLVGYLCVAIVVSISLNRIEKLETNETIKEYQREIALRYPAK